MPKPFDIAIVPDFRAGRERLFELRTLIFLASWIENAGAARDFPLHLACIGPPPEAVLRLAEQAGALITVHEPLSIEGRSVANKLRAFEAGLIHDQLLLLDADVFLLADPSGLGDFGRCISASYALQDRVPEDAWRKIYKSLEIPYPKSRVRSLFDKLDLPRALRSVNHANSNGTGMPPYFGTGVLFVPTDIGFHDLWREHIDRIRALAVPGRGEWESMARSDQAGASTAIQHFVTSGIPFRELPDPFAASWIHLYRRVVTEEEAILFHAFIFGKTRPTARGNYRKAIRNFRRILKLGPFIETARQDLVRGRFSPLLHDTGPAYKDCRSIGDSIDRLYERHVAPLVETTNGK